MGENWSPNRLPYKTYAKDVDPDDTDDEDSDDERKSSSSAEGNADAAVSAKVEESRGDVRDKSAKAAAAVAPTPKSSVEEIDGVQAGVEEPDLDDGLQVGMEFPRSAGSITKGPNPRSTVIGSTRAVQQISSPCMYFQAY